LRFEQILLVVDFRHQNNVLDEETKGT